MRIVNAMRNVVKNMPYKLKDLPYTCRAILNQTKPIRAVLLAWEMVEGGEDKQAY